MPSRAPAPISSSPAATTSTTSVTAPSKPSSPFSTIPGPHLPSKRAPPCSSCNVPSCPRPAGPCRSLLTTRMGKSSSIRPSSNRTTIAFPASTTSKTSPPKARIPPHRPLPSQSILRNVTKCYAIRQFATMLHPPRPPRSPLPPHHRTGSLTVRIWSARTFFSVCTIPLGQRISSDWIPVSTPSPKCTRLSLDDMKPSEVVT